MGFLDWFSHILEGHPLYEYLLPFFGAAIAGEGAVLTVAGLAATGAFPATQVFIMSFLGTMCSDLMWFLIGRSNWWLSVGERKYLKKGFGKIAETIQNISRGKHFSALIITKFLYGTRIIMLLYLNRTHLRLKKFIFYNAVATALWLLVLVPAGYFAGQGFLDLIKIIKNFEIALAILVVLVVAFYIIRKWVDQRFIEKRNQ